MQEICSQNHQLWISLDQKRVCLQLHCKDHSNLLGENQQVNETAKQTLQLQIVTLIAKYWMFWFKSFNSSFVIIEIQILSKLVKLPEFELRFLYSQALEEEEEEKKKSEWIYEHSFEFA